MTLTLGLIMQQGRFQYQKSVSESMHHVLLFIHYTSCELVLVKLKRGGNYIVDPDFDTFKYIASRVVTTPKI